MFLLFFLVVLVAIGTGIFFYFSPLVRDYPAVLDFRESVYRNITKIYKDDVIYPSSAITSYPKDLRAIYKEGVGYIYNLYGVVVHVSLDDGYVVVSSLMGQLFKVNLLTRVEKVKTVYFQSYGPVSRGFLGFAERHFRLEGADNDLEMLKLVLCTNRLVKLSWISWNPPTDEERVIGLEKDEVSERIAGLTVYPEKVSLNDIPVRVSKDKYKVRGGFCDE